MAGWRWTHIIKSVEITKLGLQGEGRIQNLPCGVHHCDPKELDAPLVRWPADSPTIVSPNVLAKFKKGDVVFNDPTLALHKVSLCEGHILHKVRLFLPKEKPKTCKKSSNKLR